MLHADHHAGKIIDRADVRRRVDVHDQALAGADVGFAERRHELALGGDRRAGCDAVPAPISKTAEDTVEIGPRVAVEPPLQPELAGDRLHELNVEAVGFSAFNELEWRIGECGADAKDTGSDGADAHELIESLRRIIDLLDAASGRKLVAALSRP